MYNTYVFENSLIWMYNKRNVIYSVCVFRKRTYLATHLADVVVVIDPLPSLAYGWLG